MNQYRISVLISAEDEGQALINLAETIEEHPDISGIFTVEHVFASEPPKHEQIERDESDLDPRLTPFYENKQRVEITWKPGYEDYTGYGARTEGRKARGTIGKSTGWKPVYLLILTARSAGGGAILSSAIESVRAI